MRGGRRSKKELGLWNWNSACLSTASSFIQGARFPSPQSRLCGGPAVVRPREESGRWYPFRRQPAHVGALRNACSCSSRIARRSTMTEEGSGEKPKAWAF